MKVDVICDWDSPLEQIVTRGDGFIKALEILGKEWVIENYSAEVYADKLKQGILSIC